MYINRLFLYDFSRLISQCIFLNYNFMTLLKHSFSRVCIQDFIILFLLSVGVYISLYI